MRLSGELPPPTPGVLFPFICLCSSLLVAIFNYRAVSCFRFQLHVWLPCGPSPFGRTSVSSRNMFLLGSYATVQKLRAGLTQNMELRSQIL